jgi:hypothetical protein
MVQRERPKRRDTQIGSLLGDNPSQFEATIVKIGEGQLEISRGRAVPRVHGLEGIFLPCPPGLISPQLKEGDTVRVSLHPLKPVESGRVYEVIRGETRIISLYRDNA